MSTQTPPSPPQHAQSTPFPWSAQLSRLRATLHRVWIGVVGALLLLGILGPSPAVAQDAFITTWETNTANETVTIPTEGGSTVTNYDFTIDWGDGTPVQTITGDDPDPSHTYTSAGTYTVEISGVFPHLYLNGGSNAPKLQSVERWGAIQWESMDSAFEGADDLVLNTTSPPDLTNVSIMREMFANATSFNADISSWDVSNVTDMSMMFAGASSFNQDLDSWDVSNVTTTFRMFDGATSFNGDVGAWDVSSVKDMSRMFRDASSFNQDIGGWDVSSVTDISGMFRNASSFNQDIGAWNVSNALSTARMFRGATAFNQDIGSWDVSRVSDMSAMFRDATTFNQDIGGWDVSNVVTMHRLFRDASSFNKDIGEWDVSGVSDMFRMFYGATAFNQDIGGWDVSQVQNMSEMFRNASSFNQNIGRWDVSTVTQMERMFAGATAFNQNISGWNVSSVNEMGDMFAGATSFNQNLGNWDVSNVTSFHTADGFLFGTDLASSNYDALLTGWEQLDLHDGVNFHGGNGNYSVSVGEPARDAIKVDDSWTFTDGGVISPQSITLTDGASYAPPNGTPGTDDNPIGRLEMTADASGTTIPAIILTFSEPNQGVERVRIWHSSSPTFSSSTAQPLGSTSLSPSTSIPSEVLVTGLDQTISTSATFLYVTVDLTASATGDTQVRLADGPDFMREGGVLTNASDEFPMPLSSASTALPVEFATFVATAQQQDAVLSWTTASETDNAGFYVQRRSPDAGAAKSNESESGTGDESWTRIGFVKGAGTTNESQSYRFVDEKIPFAASQMHYRLRQVDASGTSTYSDVRTVDFQAPESVALHAPFPNPTSGSVTLRYALPQSHQSGRVFIDVYDVMGRRVASVHADGEIGGRKQVRLSTSTLSPGTYFVRLKAQGVVKTRRLTVVR